jgi:hypothetical protein
MDILLRFWLGSLNNKPGTRQYKVVPRRKAFPKYLALDAAAHRSEQQPLGDSDSKE